MWHCEQFGVQFFSLEPSGAKIVVFGENGFQQISRHVFI